MDEQLDFELDERLIEEIRKRPFLYDVQHADYKDLRKKNRAWMEISKKLKAKVSLCKSKWKCLRSSYTRIRRRSKGSKTAKSKIRRYKWRHLESMSFLNNLNTSRLFSHLTSHSSLLHKSDDILEPESGCSKEVAFENCDNSIASEDHSMTELDSINDAMVLSPTPASNSTTQSSVKKQITISGNTREKPDTTAMYFACLAEKIVESNLPKKAVTQIELKAAAIVYSEIQNYQNRNM